MALVESNEASGWIRRRRENEKQKRLIEARKAAIETRKAVDAARDWLLVGSKQATDALVAEAASRRWISQAEIMRVVAERRSIGVHDLTSHSRIRDYAWARQEVMYLTRVLTGRGYPSIGKALGGRDHQTVWYGCKAFAARHGLPSIDQIDRMAALRLLYEGPRP
jgi:chromosomal replication initiation ATPase DnaA